MTEQEILADCIIAFELAYAPYSGFKVGVVLVGADGRTFRGCNVENVSYGLTICAERSAVSAAIAAGCRDFSKIVILADTDEPVSPCGACRQVLAEFNPDMEIILANFHGKTARYKLSELLPRPTTGILNRA